MRFTLPIIALAALATPAVASVDAAEEQVTVKISYGDLDLTTSAGVEALEARIEAKLRRACTVDTPSRFAYGKALRDERCIAEARADAMSQANRVARVQQNRASQVAAK